MAISARSRVLSHARLVKKLARIVVSIANAAINAVTRAYRVRNLVSGDVSIRSAPCYAVSLVIEDLAMSLVARSLENVVIRVSVFAVNLVQRNAEFATKMKSQKFSVAMKTNLMLGLCII